MIKSYSDLIRLNDKFKLDLKKTIQTLHLTKLEDLRKSSSKKWAEFKDRSQDVEGSMWAFIRTKSYRDDDELDEIADRIKKIEELRKHF